MSIINEALKKAQGSERQGLTKDEVRPLKTQEGPGAVPPQPKGNKKFIFFIIFLAVIIGAIFVKKYLPNAPTLPLLSPRPSEVNHFPRLSLNGIVYDEARPYAIVNNKVLLEGEVIEGATLLEIKQDKVKFSFNDEEFELSAK